ncbi:MAG: hypothetical protein AMXMBFR83_31310 [Phycisphaerae bacterium]|jgi:hypothetical protein
MVNGAMMAATGGMLLEAIFSERMQQLMPLALAIVAVFFMTLSLRRRQQQSRRPRPEPPLSPRHAGEETRRDLDELMVELQELSRRISAEIDTRFAKLEAAMRDADRRIAVLHRLARLTEGHRPVGSTANGQADGQVDGRHAVVYELADAGFTPVDIARELGRTPGEVELILNLRKRSGPEVQAGA